MKCAPRFGAESFVPIYEINLFRGLSSKTAAGKKTIKKEIV